MRPAAADRRATAGSSRPQGGRGAEGPKGGRAVKSRAKRAGAGGANLRRVRAEGRVGPQALHDIVQRRELAAGEEQQTKVGELHLVLQRSSSSVVNADDKAGLSVSLADEEAPAGTATHGALGVLTRQLADKPQVGVKACNIGGHGWGVGWVRDVCVTRLFVCLPGWLLLGLERSGHPPFNQWANGYSPYSGQLAIRRMFGWRPAGECVEGRRGGREGGKQLLVLRCSPSLLAGHKHLNMGANSRPVARARGVRRGRSMVAVFIADGTALVAGEGPLFGLRDPCGGVCVCVRVCAREGKRGDAASKIVGMWTAHTSQREYATIGRCRAGEASLGNRRRGLVARHGPPLVSASAFHRSCPVDTAGGQRRAPRVWS